MAFSSGSVSTFSGAGGLLQALLDFVCGTEVEDESLGVPDGIETYFDGTLAHYPVGLGRFVLTYTISSVVHQAVDDGAGNIAGTGITAGTIDYPTGDFEITFTTPPDNGSSLTANYITGDPGRDWRVECHRNTRSRPSPGYTEPFGSDCKEVILSNTGMSGQEAVIIGIREWRYPAANAHGWGLNGYLLYESPADWNSNSNSHGRTSYDTTWHHYTTHPMLPLINDTMYYWIYSNQQRIVVVVKVQSNYESAYLGFGRRFGTPGDYPYPLCVIGSLYGNSIFSSTDADHTYIASCNQSSNYKAWIVEPANQYMYWNGSADQPVFLPRNPFATLGTMDHTANGRYLMTPVYICKYIGKDNLMDLDGVLHCMGVGVQSEDTLTFEGKTFRVFQNVFRTDYYEFMAIRED